MANDKTKQQRDRFLAFAFASADLFIEVGPDSIVSYALGAARALTGINEETIIGHPWLDLFSQADRSTIFAMRGRAKTGSRCGPYAVKLDETLGGGREAIVTGIKMPESQNFYLTIGFTNVLMSRVAQQTQESEDQELLDKDSFLTAAKEAMDMARSLGQNLDLTLIDIENISDVKKRLGDDNWGKFTDAITHLLNARSADGRAAAEVAEGRYSVIHDSKITSDLLKEEIERLSRESDPGGNGFTIQEKTVSADLSSLSERDTTKALIYTINEFERKGTSLTIENLNSGFKAYVSANAQKILQFKTMVEQLSFDLHFQPIVNLEDRSLSHFEMLSRFRDNGSTQEWIIFGEDIGMAADFDIAVCERAINYLLYKSQGRRTKFAINLSGQSIQNEQFFRTLRAKLDMNRELAERIIFEITESTTIQNLEMVNHFIEILQNDGYKVCLDDFGAGSASFQYLQRLHVDYVKIDGQYTSKILTSERDAIMIKNLGQMCLDLNVEVIAEKIEDHPQLERLKNLGIGYGQGFLFAHPGPKPDYEGPKAKK